MDIFVFVQQHGYSFFGHLFCEFLGFAFFPKLSGKDHKFHVITKI